MISFIARRLLVSLPILVASTMLVFLLVTLAGDPAAQIAESGRPNAEQLAAQMRANLNLDAPLIERYFDWLAGVIPIGFDGSFPFVTWQGIDFGLTREGQSVNVLLQQRLTTSLRLVLFAVAMAIVLGMIIGIISAVRQYSVIDYASTLWAFLCFSLPVFWLAVMLKEYGAIKFNDFLENPGISNVGVVVVALLSGLVIAGLAGGTWRRRAVAASVGAIASFASLAIIDATDWMQNPGLAPIARIIGAAIIGVIAAGAFAPLSNRRVLAVSLASAGVAVVGAFLLHGWISDPSWWQVGVMLVLTIASGVLVGSLAGVIDRRDGMKAAVAAGIGVGLIVGLDEFISAWSPGRTIGTIGPQTPNLVGGYWERLVDYFGHQILPSLALMLIGFATFMRFTRASMLDTLKSDYVRTAKAKGLPVVQVVLRHAFRTALIPVVTVATLSFAQVIEGAVITETVFGWRGMGLLFVDGLTNVDPYPVLGFLLVVSVSIIVMNAIADLLYASLDPRIRR